MEYILKVADSENSYEIKNPTLKDFEKVINVLKSDADNFISLECYPALNNVVCIQAINYSETENGDEIWVEPQIDIDDNNIIYNCGKWISIKAFLEMLEYFINGRAPDVLTLNDFTVDRIIQNRVTPYTTDWVITFYDFDNASNEFLSILADKGNPVAQYILANRFYGIGQKFDINAAMDLFTKSAEQGLVIAQYRLGCIYFYGDVIKKDYSLAFNWFSRAAKQEYAPAQYHLGICFRDGKGTGTDNSVNVQDFDESVLWFTKAAEQGHSMAQYCLGMCYKDKLGVFDYSKAVEWFYKSAKQGNTKAIYSLGECFYNGFGVKQNQSKAIELYKIAAKNGNTSAKKVLKNLGVL